MPYPLKNCLDLSLIIGLEAMEGSCIGSEEEK